MTKATNNVARVAAAVAGFGLVAMGFAPLAGAQTTTTTTTTTTTPTFTRDLTVGSTGADVTALQTWLVAKGFSIPAGATGYFGAQTKAALAAYQAANMITPAAGYFGPITRAKLAAAGGSTTTGGTTTTTGTLSGGEARLGDVDLLSGDDLDEGDTGTEIAVARFDVRDADVSIQRVTLEFTGGSAGSKLPWKYFDSLSVVSNGKTIGDIDSSSKSDWDKTGNTYSIDIPVNGIIKEGDNQELSIQADAVSTIDSDDQDQTFSLAIDDDGIRAVDGAGIQQYTGDDSETVTVGFGSSESGDLTVSKSSDSPKSGVLVADDQDTSDEFDVLAFRIKNSDDTDVDLNELTFNVAVTGATTTDNIVRRATLDLDGDTYTGTIGTSTIDFDDLDTSVGGDDSIDGVLSITLFGTDRSGAVGQTLVFSLVGNPSNVDAEGSENGDTADVTGTATGEKQSIGVDGGIVVAGNSNTTSESYNTTTTGSSTGTFSLKFDVTANGDDIYVPKSAASTTEAASTTAGIVFDPRLGASTSGVSVPASITSTADTFTGGYYVVHDGDTETFTVNVTFDPTTAGYYQVGLDAIHFKVGNTSNPLQVLDIDQTDSDFQTNQLYIH